MKHLSLLLLFSSFLLVGCQESKKKSSSSSSNNYCVQYPQAWGCAGQTGGTTGGANCNPPQFGQTQCPNYCQIFNCGGTTGTTGTTTGTTSGGTTGGTNPYTNIGSSALPNWPGKYPGGQPTGSCSSPYTPSGLTGAYDTRQATMTIVGKSWYNPSSPEAPSYMNTSSRLRSVNEAKILLSTDSFLKVRFKVRPQPESSSSSPYCYNRQPGSPVAGYTKLQFNVRLVGQRANGTIDYEPLGTHTIGVNSCTPGIDLSYYKGIYPQGLYLIVENVKGNTAFFPNNYESFGFRDVNQFVDVPTKDCWSLDVEVAADGTKTFD
jgi:hypothetical protein